METVRFFTAPDVTLAADLYLPEGPPPEGGFPSIITCLGWGSVKELMRNWGDALSALRYAVLVPDYRGFGASDGERGRCFPDEHVADIRAALTYAGQRPEIDSARLSLVGVSYGGAIAVAAAGQDQRPQAVVSVVGYGSGRRHLRAVRSESQWEEFSTRLEADALQRIRTGISEEVDPGEILLRDEEARDWRSRMEAELPHMAFRTTLESAQRIVDFAPEQALPFGHSTASLFIHAGGDMMVPVAESEGMWERSTEPRKLVVIPDIDHHAVHRGEPFERVISEIDSWLSDHIAGPGA